MLLGLLLLSVVLPSSPLLLLSSFQLGGTLVLWPFCLRLFAVRILITITTYSDNLGGRRRQHHPRGEIQHHTNGGWDRSTNQSNTAQKGREESSTTKRRKRPSSTTQMRRREENHPSNQKEGASPAVFSRNTEMANRGYLF